MKKKYDLVTAKNYDIVVLTNLSEQVLTVGSICGAILPKNIIQIIYASEWYKLFENSEWVSYSAGYLGDADEGDFICNGQTVTAQLLEKFQELTSSSSKCTCAFGVSLLSAMIKMGGIIIHCDYRGNFFLEETADPPGLWKKRKNLKGKAVTCLPFNNYFPEKLSFSMEEIISSGDFFHR